MIADMLDKKSVLTDKAGLNILVLGASGDLARHKILPAFFALFCHGLLPAPFQIIGFARSLYNDETFRNLLAETLTCRYRPQQNCQKIVADFLRNCFYVPGDYANSADFLRVRQIMRRLHVGQDKDNRIFYMAVPPLLFQDTARAIDRAGLVYDTGPCWSRAIIEKPFGKDRNSSDRLVDSLHEVFTEDQTYRIDHYLGKEVIQNLLTLRFANTVFEPLWNNRHIAKIDIVWHEDIGMAGRGGYFDNYGIIRDVIQNHLLQILALTAMERPFALDQPDAVRSAKVRLLRNIIPPVASDFVIGQYTTGSLKGKKHQAYLEETHVQEGSLTPTYAAVKLKIDNPRWRGVTFKIEAGKALADRLTEIRICFHPVPAGIFHEKQATLADNALIIRVQPDESIYLCVNNKVPGLELELTPTKLDLRYAEAFRQRPIPQAYESLLWEVLKGDRSLFISEEELAAAWDICTPALVKLDFQTPVMYSFGSSGPLAELK